MTLSLVVDNDATVNAAIIARHGSCVVITINGGISHSAHQFRAACPTEGLAWERRANESLEQFHGRVFQSARANNARVVLFGGYPNISHAQELDLIDKAHGMEDGARLTVPLGG